MRFVDYLMKNRWIGDIIAIIILVFLFIIAYHSVKKDAKEIAFLFSKGYYEKCMNKILKLEKFHLKINPFFKYYKAMIFTYEKKYDIAQKLLKSIKRKKLIERVRFWECFILICQDKIDEAKIFLNDLKQKNLINEDNSNILLSFIKKKENNDFIMDKELLTKVNNPVILAYIKDNF